MAGAILLAFVVLLARYGTAQEVQGMRITPLSPGSGAYGRCPRPDACTPPRAVTWARAIAVQRTDWTVQAVQETALQQMLLWSGVGLVIMSLLAAATGWWLAGRALRPISVMTDTARRIGDLNLHERLALTGPDDGLHRLADTLDGMLDRLQKAFDSQRRFVANASHELRSPLAVQRSSLEVGLADPLPEGLAEVREDLLAGNRDAERLIAALLLLAGSDRGLAETEQVDLAALARQSVAAQSAQAKEHEVTVDVTVHGPPVAVDGDPVLLRHLTGNLLGNAIHPGPPLPHRHQHRARGAVRPSGGPLRALPPAGPGPCRPPRRPRPRPVHRAFHRRRPRSGADRGAGPATCASRWASRTRSPRPAGGRTGQLRVHPDGPGSSLWS